VASVLAMMFMVMFSSLAIAMAVASQGNVRTASTHMHVLKAMGAAETGLAIAEKQLADAVSRFIVEKGVVDGAFGWRLWTGDYGSSDLTVNVAPAPNGRPDQVQTRGIADALLNAHYHDGNVITGSAVVNFTTPQEFTPTDPDLDVFKENTWVRTPLIAIDGSAADNDAGPAAYQITYAPLANGTDVRIIVTGFSSVGANGSSYHYGATSRTASAARPVTRVIQQDYRIVKRPAHALLSPSRIMIGKNVRVVGSLGARYTDVDQTNGDPITIKSDFYGLNPQLDSRLRRFFDALRASDVDQDNRLRIGHATEGAAIPGDTDTDGDGQPDGAYSDATRDGYVDEFDIFINFYDANKDGRVALAASLTAGTPAEGVSAEFTADNDLALLIDGGMPDRNRNGVSGWVDTNRNGRWDNGEPMNDCVNGRNLDQVLGWRDGFIDRKDQYAKVRGRLMFKVNQSAWLAANPNYEDKLLGPIVPDKGKQPEQFGLSDRDLPSVTAANFTNSQTPLKTAADGASFEQQVAANLGISVGQLATYTESQTDATAKRYWRADLDDSYVYSRTGRHLWERTPFNAPTYTDFYIRPRYENMVFKNVRIPRGNNGLFINCTFVGVTYVQSYADNGHTNWQNYGKMQWSDSQAKPVPVTTPLDKSDFARYTTGNIVDGPANYSSFPDPPVIDGEVKTGAARNTKLYSNNLRFHDCLFVGSIVSDTPSQFTQVRNKMQFTGATRFTTENPDHPDDSDLNPDSEDLSEIAKSSMMLPNYSVDIGSFNSPTDTYTGNSAPTPQNVQLSGTVVAGVLDVRGNTRIEGALMLTFAPTAGEGPLQSNGQAVGNPANFNSTLGYFGPADGDSESVDPETLPVVNGQKIAGWDTDGDGIADKGPEYAPTSAELAAGTTTAVPFYGYGRVELIWNPDMAMPDGVMLPVSLVPLTMSYREGKQ
jgi:hypothetical protein